MSSMSKSEQRALAERFRALHRPGTPFVLGNAWDVASARLFETCGIQAVGTTSAGMAAVLGYADTEAIPVEELAAMVRRIVAFVRVPVSVDVEAGFGATPADVAATVRRMLEAGAVGVNLEDGVPGSSPNAYPMEAAVARVRAACEAAEAFGVPAVVNARTDILWRKVGPEGAGLDQALRRLRAYAAAGASCVFAPGLQKPADIEAVARGAGAPLNVLATKESPPLPELARLGVARVSLGSGPMRAGLTVVRRIAQELQASGTYAAFTEGVVTYAELQALVTEVGRS
jgi:2-methylisocitrate lyase-like PEP mutase family enzyme